MNFEFEAKDHIAIITINHPPANTFNLAALEEFENVIDRVESDNDIRVVIITGAGEKCFSAGFDVNDKANIQLASPLGRRLWQRIDCFPKPVIAAINGHALGGGLELAMSCHFRIMVDKPKAMLGLTELNLGIIPGWGGTQRLPRIVGRKKALDMILFSKKISPAKALKIGLVDKKSDSGALMDDALAFSQKIAKLPPIAVRCVLNAFSAGLYEGLVAGLEKEAQGSAIVRDTEDRNEGFTAFLERRKPQFSGK
ncbi:MAG: enoyl-CoA hydratase/isomerase family protein [Proteobacteria bacterium]|nr:enoyl-CoA hydratase/isomerase family protein [Pseudomonadota bacterium]MBU1695842.1 enoyl-CoA hydratase/isomerase family protein [Pseudomonadota bacterium]